jgi:hypothetical protein
MNTAHLPISPSKTLFRFADQIASFGKGSVLDASCGYGRNAVALQCEVAWLLGLIGTTNGLCPWSGSRPRNILYFARLNCFGIAFGVQCRGEQWGITGAGAWEGR